MNTKKFEVQFDSATHRNGLLELKACVHTDNTFHYARQRTGQGRDEPVVWADMGRTYTPQQLHHVNELLNYHAPIVRQAIAEWLTAHNFPTSEEIEKAGTRLRIQLDSNCVVSYFEYGH